MKYCSKCKVEVIGDMAFCPLCQSELLLQGEVRENIYPTIKEHYTANHMVLKILEFISIIIGILSIFFNIILPSSICWSLIVLVTLGGGWLSIRVAILKHRNLVKYFLNQSVIICIFAMVIDYITGHNGWAITFVVPTIFSLAMIVMYLLSKILHLQAGDYMIYLLLDGLFGIFPLLFLITDKVQTDIPSLVCILISIISVAGLIVFEGNAMLSELKRRLHV